MKNVSYRRTIVTGIMIIVGSMAGYSQALDVQASGTKTVTLNNKVGKNQFTWVSDAPLEKIKGTAGGVKGSFTIDPANPSGIRGTISASVSTMKTGNSTRDRHLKSDDWLNASSHPRISCTITSIRNVSANGNRLTGTAVGRFTMNGVTKTESIQFTLTYLDESSATRKRAQGDLVMVEASLNISLSDYNVKGKEGYVGSKVGESIKVTAKLFGSTG